MKDKHIHISFGMIVLNGEPFTRYNLRAIYQWAHQIIIVEGACRTAKTVATLDGHSRDGTKEELQRFQKEDDPENKVFIVNARDEGYADGFWPEKDEMCQAYARRVTGNVLWHIDADEFYIDEDIEQVIKLFANGADGVGFPQITFMGALSYAVDGLFLRWDFPEVPRVYRWQSGYNLVSHRPPTVTDECGVDLRKKVWVSAREMKRKGIFMYHYSLLFPVQVEAKTAYYMVDSTMKSKQGGGFNPEMNAWVKDSFKRIRRPFHVHNVVSHISWVYEYKGRHPVAVEKMMCDIRTGRQAISLRGIEDIQRLCQSRFYGAAVLALRFIAQIGETALGRLMVIWSRAVWRRVGRLVRMNS